MTKWPRLDVGAFFVKGELGLNKKATQVQGGYLFMRNSPVLHFVENVLHWVETLAVSDHLVMEMRTGGIPG